MAYREGRGRKDMGEKKTRKREREDGLCVVEDKR